MVLYYTYWYIIYISGRLLQNIGHILTLQAIKRTSSTSSFSYTYNTAPLNQPPLFRDDPVTSAVLGQIQGEGRGDRPLCYKRGEAGWDTCTSLNKVSIDILLLLYEFRLYIKLYGFFIIPIIPIFIYTNNALFAFSPIPSIFDYWYIKSNKYILMKPNIAILHLYSIYLSVIYLTGPLMPVPNFCRHETS